MKVGFIGAGRMGAPMVYRLARAGHDVRVLGRSPEKRSALAELGTTAVGDLAQVAGGADAVVVCVFTDQQVRTVCLDGGLLGAMAAGSVLVVHTTGSPRTVEDLAAVGTDRDVAVVDAPVSGGPHDIAAGALTVFAGGSVDAVAQVQPVLSAYADPLLHVGALGAGQIVKLVNNTLFAASIGAVAAGVELAGRLGVGEARLLAALQHGSAGRALAGIAARGSVTSFVDVAGGFVGKDIEVVRAVLADLGGDLGVLENLVTAGLDAGSRPDTANVVVPGRHYC